MSERIADVGTYEGFTLARVVGGIDLSNASDLAKSLTTAVDGGATPGLILDMSSVVYVDSAGVRALFDVIRSLESRRQVVALVVPESSPIRALIKVTNLHEAVPVCGTAKECAVVLRRAEELEDFSTEILRKTVIAPLIPARENYRP